MRRHSLDSATQEVATSAEAKRNSQDSPNETNGTDKASLEEWQTVYNKLHLREPVVTVREPEGIPNARYKFNVRNVSVQSDLAGTRESDDVPITAQSRTVSSSQTPHAVPVTEVEPVPHKQSATTRETRCSQVHMLAERLTSFQETQEQQMGKLIFQLQEQLRRAQEDQQQSIEEVSRVLLFVLSFHVQRYIGRSSIRGLVSRAGAYTGGFCCNSSLVAHSNRHRGPGHSGLR
eukprot:6851000-Pyramimonas_sp.AAC.2